MPYTRLFLLVEGDDDQSFVERVVIPKLSSWCNSVQAWRYAQRKAEKVNAFLRSIKSMGAEYLSLPSSHATQRPGLPSRTSPPDLHRKLMDGIVSVYGAMPKQLATVPDPLAELVKEVQAVVPDGQPVWFFTTNYDTVIESLPTRGSPLVKNLLTVCG